MVFNFSLIAGSKIVGWQLCSNASYPFPAEGFSLPPPGPVSVSLRLLKLDRGLHYYLLEAAYSLLTQVLRNANMVLHHVNEVKVNDRTHSLAISFSEGQLAAQRGLPPPSLGHSPVLHPQGHVSGCELQPSQTASEDYSSSENHPDSR